MKKIMTMKEIVDTEKFICKKLGIYSNDFLRLFDKEVKKQSIDLWSNGTKPEVKKLTNGGFYLLRLIETGGLCFMNDEKRNKSTPIAVCQESSYNAFLELEKRYPDNPVIKTMRTRLKNYIGLNYEMP